MPVIIALWMRRTDLATATVASGVVMRDKMPSRLGARDGDSHVESALDLRLSLCKSTVPIGHAGIFTDHEASRSQVGGHLLGSPCADLRLADQSEHQPGKEPAMNRVIVHDQGGCGRTPLRDAGKCGAHRIATEVHHD